MVVLTAIHGQIMSHQMIKRTMVFFSPGETNTSKLRQMESWDQNYTTAPANACCKFNVLFLKVWHLLIIQTQLKLAISKPCTHHKCKHQRLISYCKVALISQLSALHVNYFSIRPLVICST